jgi:hypothetical protein
MDTYARYTKRTLAETFRQLEVLLYSLQLLLGGGQIDPESRMLTHC